MRALLLTAATAAALTLGACGSDTTSTSASGTGSTTSSSAPAVAASESAASESAASESAASESAASETGDSAPGAYIDYATYQADPGAYAGGDVVLFFHATWCPSCKATDESLTGTGVPDGLTVVKVDYDSATDLKKKHKITYQHTFVEVDADGNELAKWSGSVTGEEIKAKASA